MDVYYRKRQLSTALWASLLLAGLICSPAVAGPPTGEGAKLNELTFVDNGDGSYTLDWYVANPGDYDQNGEVNISDLALLGGHFQESGPFDPASQAYVVDGDVNGEININDLTPIGACFGNQLIEYRVYMDESELLATVLHGDGTALPGERLRFSVTVTPAQPPVSFTVVPSDGLAEGTSTELQTGLNAPELSWAHTWGGVYSDVIQAVCAGAGGRSLAVGQTVVPGNGYDAMLLVYSASGELEQAYSTGGTGFEAFYAICPDGNGGWVAAGTTSSGAVGGADCLLAFIDADGQLASMRTWGGIADDIAYDLALDASGNVYIAGTTRSFGAGDEDALLLKFDPQGVVQWSMALGGTDRDLFTSLALSPQGFLVAGGTTGSLGGGGEDALFAQVTVSGGLLWHYAWGDRGHERVMDLVLDDNGSFIATGMTEMGLANGDAFVLKHDVSGIGIGWARTWGGYGWEGATSLVLDSAGGIIFAGATASFPSVSQDLFLGRFNAEGVPIWAARWGASDSYNDGFAALAWGSGGELIIGGYTASRPSSGQLEWEALQLSGLQLTGVITSGKLDEVSPIGIATSPNLGWIEVTGETDHPGGSQDAVIMRTTPARLMTPQ